MTAPQLADEATAARLVDAARILADRFDGGGRLIAIGSGRAGIDARHIAVEFVHPVIVGRRALPALTGVDRSGADVVVGVSYGGTPDATGIHLPLPEHPVDGPHAAVVFYHVLWEMTHVFLRTGRDQGGSGGEALDALYPMLTDHTTDSQDSNLESVMSKLSEADRLRAATIASNEAAIERFFEIVDASSTVFTFGNARASCWASTRSTSPTRASSSPSSRRSTPTRSCEPCDRPRSAARPPSSATWSRRVPGACSAEPPSEATA